MAPGSNSPECGGCYNCYAARQALRMSGPGGAYEGLVKLTAHGPRWTGKVIEGDMDAPLHVRKPSIWFVDSMSDLFHESLPDETMDRAFAVMALCPQHTFQILTKRAERMRRWASHPHRWNAIQLQAANVSYDVLRLSVLEGLSRFAAAADWPLPNVWLGVSCETQPAADARIPHLLRTPAALRFVSLEPMLGPIGMFHWLHPDPPGGKRRGELRPGLDWVIVGGESGPGARPFDLSWARRVVEQCKAARVPVFVKQLGSHWAREGQRIMPLPPDKWDRKGGDPAEWPEDLRIRQYPEVRR